jgi:chromosome partitioning protein
MKSLALVSRKGGSGKSLLAIHIAVAFDTRGVNTSVIDLDPQRSAWNFGEDRGKGNYPDVYAPRLDQLSGFMDDLAGNDVKLVVIDTPPHSDERSLAAIRLAELVLVPFRPSLLDLRALEDTARLVGVAEKTAQTVLVMNATPNRSPLVQEAMEAAATFGLAVCPVTISDRTAFNHAITAAQGVTEYEPMGKAAQEIVELRRFIAKQLKIKKGTL